MVVCVPCTEQQKNGEARNGEQELVAEDRGCGGFAEGQFITLGIAATYLVVLEISVVFWWCCESLGKGRWGWQQV